MSLADALVPPTNHVPKVEDSQPDERWEVTDVNMQPQSDHAGEDTESAQAHDEDMQDLFGEDAAAEETKHEECVNVPMNHPLPGILLIIL